MTDLSPPFRAGHVGSLLRPKSVVEARKKHFEEGSISAEELKAAEDKAIPDLIRMQEDVGLKAVTDGEARRSFWHYDFMGMLTGLDLDERDEGVQFAGVKLRPIYPTITGKLDFPDDHPMLDHFRFVKDHTSVVPKISIPGPSCCHFRTAPEDIHVAEYKEDTQALFDDLAKTYRKAVSAFYDAGCRFLQMDDIFFAYLCDPKHRAEKKEQGQDPDWLIDRYAWMMREAIKDRPADMKIGMHMCRGNFRSTHAAEGAYDAAAEAIFSTGVDIFFMEYDTDRAGGLEPLGLLPKGKQRIMPGFITTKTAELESLDWLKSKFDEASKYVDLDQLGIAPQCGFASTEEGNAITEDDQKRKLELVVKTAEAIWGGV
ncbi:5-methyltetrahydropteroyltriglutamate--homocysteine S-methyltransferase [Psychromarinibacter sp. C21-152]|uniref:5-methyltetrahydropteroyltriglutamate--homocysteine S-methyltransferase n=1 Tax=Psychromarinibacter sediminicola TaxID=3033385 RepID=A0AAE3NLC6_9RHOB|nr:5-methyltetrahydropteroyltriglutamate--homocysteine S-methyltransferase [Psychromarinibacter sediminicola]MDF0599398.1 5-methyltetrahydropteroyltriglutamate--homocysteine S-methyltransferase [Psychromarinibacter sediminicola]